MISKIIKFIFLLVIFSIITGVFAFFTIHYLTKNQPEVIVSDFRGKEISYCLNQLDSLALIPRIKSFEFSQVVPADYIIDQAPLPGETVKKGRDVHLTISRGQKSDLMPFLYGKFIDEARIEIFKNGIKLSHLSYVHHDKVKKDHIIASSPSQGVFIKSNTDVSLLVSLGRKLKEYTMPDLTGMTIEEAEKKIAKRNLIIDKIESVFSPDFRQSVVLSQKPSQGLRVKEKTKVSLVINHMDTPSIISPIIGANVFLYKLPPSVLKSHIKTELEIYNKKFIIHDEYFSPEEEIRIAIPFDQDAVVTIYKDKEFTDEIVFKAFKINKPNNFLTDFDKINNFF
ncbi:MAG: PASTA domain-containing protein [Desulforegulaceae bacterium]|nr:PASTA domain-containing protein [Desulforegulaceae bacterium]